MAVGPGGVVYTAGANRNAAGQLDMRLVKWSSSGTVLWTRRYTGPVAGDDTATDVVVDKNGNVTVCGDSQGTRGKAFTVVSWSAAGTRRWVWRTDGGGDNDDRANAMVVDGSGNLYVTGWRYNPGIGPAGYTVKLSANGARRWSDQYEGADTVKLSAIAKRPGGGVFVCGSMLSFDTMWDGVLIGYAPGGSRTYLAFHSYGDDSVDTHFRSLAATPTGKAGVAATIGYSYGTDVRRLLLVYDPAADSSSGHIYGATSNERMVAVAADAYGGLYFVGTMALTAAHSVFWTARFPTIPGGGAWAGRFGDADVAANEPFAVTTWKTTVWVVGRVFPGGGDSDQAVLKYVY